MTLPASFWASVALFIFAGLLCRRWPLISLWGATSAFCATEQAMLRQLPLDMPLAFADSLMFVLPTVVLARACGVSNLRSLSVLLVVPCALWAGCDDPKIRASLLMLGVGAAQGSSAVLGARDEIRDGESSTARRAAVCIAAIGMLGIGFSEVWSDVAWTGVAAHAFVCLAYLAYEKREERDALLLASEDCGLPSSKSNPRSELVEDAEERP